MNKKTLLRNFLIIFVLAVLTSAFTVYSDVRQFNKERAAAEAMGIRMGAPAPDFIYALHNGGDGALSDHKGKVVILNFWASWCPPCIAEFPQLLNLAAAFPDDVVLLALSSDHEKPMMDRFIARLIKENGDKATADNVVIAWDRASSITGPVYGTVRLPETIIIGRDGIMREKVAGVIEWDGAASKARISALTGE